MAAPKKDSSSPPHFIDPDYEQTDTEAARERVRAMEERNADEQLKKLTAILDREFKTELENREKQMELIQQRYLQAEKTLHLLRYVIVTAYYNAADLEEKAQEQERSAGSSAEPLFSGRNRIHPAIRKLTGDKVDLYNLRLAETPRKVTRQEKSTAKRSGVKKEVAETIVRDAAAEGNALVEAPKCDEVQGPYFNRNRKRRNQHIVVGNISKFVPSESEQDKSTHKWMVYVRGPKDNSDISDFISKVVFYLHPSYKPNDVVELTKSPFHLARRGWGEFPLRIKIYFKYTLNKPVDIVHNLKLDKTYTGRQTLGNETVLKLHLYEDCDDDQIQIAPSTSMEQCGEKAVDLEHDYCVNNNQYGDVNITDTVMDHSYCQFDSPNVNETNANDRLIENVDTELKYGIPPDPSEKVIQEEVILDDLNKKPIYFIRKPKKGFQNITKPDGRSFTVKRKRKAHEPLLKTIFRKRIRERLKHTNGNSSDESRKYKIEFPVHRFKSAADALPFLFKRLPLITRLADDPHYKLSYPFTVSSAREYNSWSMGKKTDTERQRAKLICSLLKTGNFPDIADYTTKSVILYGRSHGYSALANYQCLDNTQSTRENIGEDAKSMPINMDNQADCDMELSQFYGDSTKMFLTDNLRHPRSFVKQTALDIGVVLKPEEIVPDVMYNASERILLEAALCLADTLLRGTRSKLVSQGKFRKEGTVIGTHELVDLIKETPNLNFLCNTARVECKKSNKKKAYCV